jgi:uncharacterized DUF497 family protein
LVGDRDGIQVSALEWDEQNTEHIRRHGVEPEDVESVLANAPLFFRNLSGRSATHIMVGQDYSGRVLYVPLVCVDWPRVWRVVTAWESRFARRLFAGQE